MEGIERQQVFRPENPRGHGRHILSGRTTRFEYPLSTPSPTGGSSQTVWPFNDGADQSGRDTKPLDAGIQSLPASWSRLKTIEIPFLNKILNASGATGSSFQPDEDQENINPLDLVRRRGQRKWLEMYPTVADRLSSTSQKRLQLADLVMEDHIQDMRLVPVQSNLPRVKS